MKGDDGCRLWQPVQADSQPNLAWSWVGGRLAPFYIYQNEPGELLQWLCHDDSTKNIVLELLLIARVHHTRLLLHAACIVTNTK